MVFFIYWYCFSLLRWFLIMIKFKSNIFPLTCFISLGTLCFADLSRNRLPLNWATSSEPGEEKQCCLCWYSIRGCGLQPEQNRRLISPHLLFNLSECYYAVCLWRMWKCSLLSLFINSHICDNMSAILGFGMRVENVFQFISMWQKKICPQWTDATFYTMWAILQEFVLCQAWRMDTWVYL